MSKASEQAAATICLSSVVDLLKSAGKDVAGTSEALLAYQALSRIKTEAEAFGVPLEDIGLDSFDIESLLQLPLKQAA